MVIVWGTRIARKRLGYVADYCVFCHAQRAFRLVSVSAKGHFMYLSLGSGKLLGHEARCMECGVTMGVDAAAYQSVSSELIDDVTRLAALTRPELAEITDSERSIVRRIRGGEATNEEKQSALERPFLILNPEVERRANDIHLDMPPVYVGLGTIALCIVSNSIVTALLTPEDGGRVQDPVTPWFGLLGLFLTLGLLFTSSLRYRRRIVYPKLGKAVAPLRPSEGELSSVLQRLASLDYVIGRKLSAKRLLAAARGG